MLTLSLEVGIVGKYGTRYDFEQREPCMASDENHKEWTLTRDVDMALLCESK